MNKKMSGLIMASAVCALFTSISYADDTQQNPAGMMPVAKNGKIACQGHNDCKGKGGCKSEANSCKGKNSCAQHAFMTSRKGCNKAKGDMVKKIDKEG